MRGGKKENSGKAEIKSGEERKIGDAESWSGEEDGTDSEHTDIGSLKQSPPPPTVSYENRIWEPENEKEWVRQIGRAVENWFRTEFPVWKSTIV